MKKILACILALAIIAPITMGAVVPQETIVATSTVTEETISLASQYVGRLYSQMLKKQLPATQASWTTKITNGQITASDLALKVFLNKSFSSRKMSDNLYLTTIYRALIGKDMPAATRKTLATKLKNGTTRRSVLKSILDSSTFTEVCKAAGMQKGSITEREYTKSENFVAKMYQVTIAKVPTLKQILGYTNKYTLGSSSAATLVDNLFKSKTYMARKTTGDQYICDIFGIIGVKPTLSKINSYKSMLNKGYSRRYLLSLIVKTKSFKNMCSIARVPVGAITLVESDRPAPKPTPTPTPVATFPNAIAIKEKLISLYQSSAQWNPKGTYMGESSMSIPVYGGFFTNDEVAEYYYRNKFGGNVTSNIGMSTVTVSISEDYIQINTIKCALDENLK